MYQLIEQEVYGMSLQPLVYLVPWRGTYVCFSLLLFRQCLRMGHSHRRHDV